MAQMKNELDALMRPGVPPVCPKCGSHRTEVIGKTDADKDIVRCHACGAISKILNTPA